MRAKIDSVYINGYCNIQIGVFNTEVFDKGMELLKDELLTLTSFKDDNLKGVITANTDGMLYTSIPYEKGWTVLVDGKKVDTVAIGGAFVGVELSAGTHTLEFSYTPEGLIPGVVISIVGIALFIAMCILTRKKPLWYAPVELPSITEVKETEENQAEDAPTTDENKETPTEESAETTETADPTKTEEIAEETKEAEKIPEATATEEEITKENHTAKA